MHRVSHYETKSRRRAAPAPATLGAPTSASARTSPRKRVEAGPRLWREVLPRPSRILHAFVPFIPVVAICLLPVLAGPLGLGLLTSAAIALGIFAVSYPLLLLAIYLDGREDRPRRGAAGGAS
jgi:hypothetical protein